MAKSSWYAPTSVIHTSLPRRRSEEMDARKNGAREGDTRGERERLPERPMKIVFTRFLRVRKIPIG